MHKQTVGIAVSVRHVDWLQFFSMDVITLIAVFP